MLILWIGKVVLNLWIFVVSFCVWKFGKIRRRFMCSLEMFNVFVGKKCFWIF